MSSLSLRWDRLTVVMMLAGVLVATMATSGCSMLMDEQPKYTPLESTTFYPDQSSARPFVDGVVPRGMVRDDVAYYTGKKTAGGNIIPGAAQQGPAGGQTGPTPGATQGADQQAAQGQALFQSLGCSACHVEGGGGTGPSLKGVYGSQVTLNNGQTATADDAYIRESILNPTAKVVQNYQPVMPSFQGRVDDNQMSQLIAYIKSLGAASQGGTPGAGGQPGGTPSAGTTAVATPAAQAQAGGTPSAGGTPGAGGGGQAAPQVDQQKASQGQALFQSLGCGACHIAAGDGAGPSLTGVYGSQVTLNNGQTVTADDNYIHESILDPTAKVVQGFQPIMPSFRTRVDDNQLGQLVEYVKSLASQQGGTPAAGGTPAPGGGQAGAVQWDPNLVDTMPFAVDKEVLLRGQERFNIFCSPCHDRVGSGNGIVVQRGYLPPPTFHSDRLRSAPVGHFFDVMTNGFGAMPSYALQVPVRDRWNIAAYIRALQLSQNATLEDVPPDQRNQLQSGASPSGTPQPGTSQPGAAATGTSQPGASATGTP